MALVGLVWIAYWNSLHVPFQFDDWHVIPENPSVRGPADIPSFYVDIATFSVLPGTRDYRPVFLTSLALAWWLGDGSTLPFHLISVTVHMCSVLLVFSIFRKMFPRRAPPDSTASSDWTAWFGAALFALHPLATESIVYISSQSVPLSAFFYLVSFRLFLEVYSADGTPGGDRSWSLRAASYLAYFIALMSKPIAITLPINLLSWELLLASPARETGIVHRLRKHLPYYIVSLVFILLRSAIMTGPFGGGPARPVSEHFLTQTGILVWHYLGRALVPVGLNVDRDWRIATSFLDARFLLAIVVIAWLGWLLYWFRHQRIIVFWSAWFPICLLLTTYGVIIDQIVSEHRVYLSLVGFCAVVALLLARLQLALERRSDHRGRSRIHPVIAIPAILLVLFYGYQTHSRNKEWSSEIALWESSVARGGGWRSNMNYALALEAAGRADEALPYFEEAVRLGSYAVPHMNLGLAHLNRGNSEAGLEHLRIASRLRPELADAHRYLGYALRSTGNLDEAETELQQAIDLQPNYIGAHAELAALYKQRRQYDSAANAYRRILEIDPAERWAEAELRAVEEAAVLSVPIEQAWEKIQREQYREAIGALEALHQEYPQRPELLFPLAFSYQMMNVPDKATRAYEELLVVSPEHRQGTFNLAYLYLDGPDREEWLRSVTLFERTLEIDPDYVEVLFRLGTAHRKLGNEDRADTYDREYVERGVHEELIERSLARLKDGKAQP